MREYLGGVGLGAKILYETKWARLTCSGITRTIA